MGSLTGSSFGALFGFGNAGKLRDCIASVFCPLSFRFGKYPRSFDVQVLNISPFSSLSVLFPSYSSSRACLIDRHDLLRCVRIALVLLITSCRLRLRY